MPRGGGMPVRPLDLGDPDPVGAQNARHHLNTYAGANLEGQNTNDMAMAMQSATQEPGVFGHSGDPSNQGMQGPTGPDVGPGTALDFSGMMGGAMPQEQMPADAPPASQAWEPAPLPEPAQFSPAQLDPGQADQQAQAQQQQAYWDGLNGNGMLGPGG